MKTKNSQASLGLDLMQRGQIVPNTHASPSKPKELLLENGGLFIKSIRPNSICDLDGRFHKNDQLTSINSISLLGMNRVEF